MKVRRAVAVALHNNQGMILVARRSQLVDEFKGDWSLPSRFYESEQSDVVTLQASLLDWFQIRSESWRLIGERLAKRPPWELSMRVYSAVALSEPALDGWKYDAAKWVNGRQFFGRADYSLLGDCAKTYLDHANKVKD